MNAIKIFEHPKFGKIRTISEDGKTLFCGIDAAVALGYKDTTNAIKQHCRWVVKRHLPHPQNPRKSIEMNFITEGDLCRLAAKSELPGADEFESWIFDEVLPSILRTGTYSIPAHRIYPPKSTSVGEIAQLLKVLRATMKENNQPAERVSLMVEGVCNQFGICLPPDFVNIDPFQQFAIFGVLLP